MGINVEKIYIFGHKNPDADSVCGAITLSNLKNELGMNTEPRILSPINKETEYILNRFNIDTPKYLNDVRVQIKDVNYHKNFIIDENKYERIEVSKEVCLAQLIALKKLCVEAEKGRKAVLHEGI